MKFVYVLEQGEDHEGSRILGLYSTEHSALWELAIAFNKRFDMYRKYTDPVNNMQEFMPVWSEEWYSFHSGCDYFQINVQQVLD